MTHKPDREKVIKECEWAIGRIEDYGSTTMTSRLFFADVAKLLKDQAEQIKILHIANDRIADYLKQQGIVRCKDCSRHGDISCPMCTKYVFETADNWYCADGERREGE